MPASSRPLRPRLSIVAGHHGRSDDAGQIYECGLVLSSPDGRLCWRRDIELDNPEKNMSSVDWFSDCTLKARARAVVIGAGLNLFLGTGQVLLFSFGVF